MARYIDADALIAEYDRVHVGAPGGARKLMVDAPAADVVEVVRCKDCKYYFDGCCYVSNRTNKGLYPRVNIHSRGRDDFCSYGERK